ncbi:MAG: alpha/beta fold hydrolase [Myxococcota bacterium]
MEGYWSLLDVSPDDRRLLVAEYRSINDTRLVELDLKDASLRAVSPLAPVASYRGAVYGPDGETIYATSDRGGEFVELYAVQGDDWTSLTGDIPWNVEGLTRSSDGRTLAFTLNINGVSALHVLDVVTGTIAPVAAVPDGRIRGLSFADSAPVLGFSLEKPDAPGDVYTVNLETDALTRWTDSEMGGLNPASFVAPMQIQYPTFDDREIPAFYYRPPGEGPFPVVINIHGGPEAQARIGFSARNQYLASEAGVAVLIPNVRGSNGYGKTYLQLDNGMKREDSVRDIGALLDWIETQPELDASRVAVSGGSYGGYMVLAALTHYPRRIRAGIDVVGISDFTSFLENTRAYRRDLRRAEYGDERDPEMRSFFEEIAPLNRADQIQSALFVAHGANDPRVPLSEARQIVDAVRQNGQDVWVMVAHDEGHGFRKKSNRDTFLMLSILFLEEHLQATP